MKLNKYTVGVKYYKVLSTWMVAAFLTLLSCNEKEIQISVSKIYPVSGVVGDIITAYGFFPNDTEVLIGATGLEIVDKTKDSIRFKIPDTISAGIKSITLRDQDSDFGPLQYTLYPTASAIDKSTLTHNDVAIISGTGFSLTPSENIVMVNSQPITVLASYSTWLQIKVPENITLGTKKLELKVSSLDSKNQLDISIFGWQKITDHPRGSFHSIASFSIADDLYFLLGVKFGQFDFAEEVWKYNLSKGAWTKVKDFPGEKLRYYAASYAINGKGYVGVGSGVSSGHLNDMWEYDPSTDSWLRLKDFPGVGRSSGCSFMLNGKVYVGTGISNGITSHNDFYSFDPILNEWKQVADYTGGQIYGASAFTLNNNKAYVVGGVINNDQPIKEVWEYNSVSDNWTKKSNFPDDASSHLASFGVNSFGYSGLGWIDSNTVSNKIWVYDPLNNSWSETNPFPGNPRRTANHGTIGKYGYYGFGYILNIVYSDLWLYLPKESTP